MPPIRLQTSALEAGPPNTHCKPPSQRILKDGTHLARACKHARGEYGEPFLFGYPNRIRREGLGPLSLIYSMLQGLKPPKGRAVWNASSHEKGPGGKRLEAAKWATWKAQSHEKWGAEIRVVAPAGVVQFTKGLKPTSPRSCAAVRWLGRQKPFNKSEG